MFYGQHAKTLDDKDRLVIPVEFRRALLERAGRAGRGGRAVEFFLTISPREQECLVLFPRDRFAELFLGFDPFDTFTDDDVKEYTRMVVGRAAAVRCDNQGRIHVPDYLKGDAGLRRDVVLVGMVDHAEIWDRERWQRYSAERRARVPEVARRLHARRQRDDSK